MMRMAKLFIAATPGDHLAKNIYRIIGVLTAVAVFGPIFALTGYLAAPRLEAILFPILRASIVPGSVIRNDGLRICWETNFTKLREGIPAYMTFLFHTGDEWIPMVVSRPDGSLFGLFGFPRHHIGDSWTSPFCLGLPHGVDKTKPITIQGTIVYQVWHGFYQPEQLLPTMEVPGE
jgi:hypothetical protein